MTMVTVAPWSPLRYGDHSRVYSFDMKYILDEQTVIATDLDGTLALSKLPISVKMAGVISEWLLTRRFAIISGAKYTQFEKQVLSQLPVHARLENLYLFPTNGAACYAFKGGI